MVFNNTVCWVVRGDETLLKRATRGIGKDRWVPPGGGIENGESPEEGAVREVFEETRLKILQRDLVNHGKINFHLNGKKEVGLVVDVFSTRKFSGEPFGSDEGELSWFQTERMPWGEMFAGDRYWAPYVLRMKGVKLSGDIFYDENFDIVSHSIKVDPVPKAS